MKLPVTVPHLCYSYNMASKKISKKPDYNGSLAEYKASINKPSSQDNNERQRQLRNNELAARARSAQIYAVKPLDARMAEAGFGPNLLSRIASRLGGGLINRGK